MAKMVVYTPTDAEKAQTLATLVLRTEADGQLARDGIAWCKARRLAILGHPGLRKAYDKASEALEAVKALRNKPALELEKLEKTLRNKVAAWDTAREKQRMQAEQLAIVAARETVAAALFVAEPDVIDDEAVVFEPVAGVAATQAPLAAVVAESVTVSLPSQASGSTRRYWKPQITDLRALLQAWLDQRVPADVVELNKDGVIPILARVEHYAAQYGMALDWPGVVNDFEDRPYIG